MKSEIPTHLRVSKPRFLPILAFLVIVAGQEATASSPAPIDQALDSYRSAIGELETTWEHFLREQTQVRVPENAKSDPNLLVDPWGTIRQETYYTPPISTIQRSDTIGDHELENLEPADLVSLIPANFRLAELIGIGRNSIHWDAQTIDATITANSGRPLTYPTLARLRYAFIGTFEVTDEIAPPGTPIETFRAIVESRSFATVGLVSTDIPWEIKHFRLLNFSMRRLTEDRPNPWTQEALHHDLRSHLRIVLPSPHQQRLQQAKVHQIESVIEKQLASWRKEVAAEGLQRSQRREPTVPTEPTEPMTLAAVLKRLQTAHEAIENLLLDAGHQAQLCLRNELVNLPTKNSIISWLQTQSDSDCTTPPWTDADKLTRLYQDLTNHVKAHQEVAP